ncbi:MAG: hypothetical protein H7330_12490 [Hymenobacteraceae bacterium]|nr:hypothetical protein [Hymenobacteraceae bacterium]
MYVPLNLLPDNARVWVYQAARDLTPAEVELAEAHLRAFCEGWAAHGHPLHGGFGLLENRFIVLAVNEDAALPSGCSIDSSVGALRALSAALGDLDLLDKAQIAYARADGTVGTIPRAELRAAVADARLTPATPVFDILVPSVGALRTGWRKPAGATWLTRYFPGIKVGS